ncbi:MAG: SUMF1/EgtB/PvdO family nonheme iron enzyme [Saprospiraceae bacterium]
MTHYFNWLPNNLDSIIKQKLENPLYEYDVNGITWSNGSLDSRLKIMLEIDSSREISLSFINLSNDTLSISNVLFDSRKNSEIYITGLGTHPLSRTHLFLPGKSPINVIVPDDAWNLGYSSSKINDSVHIFSIAKRRSWSNAERKRFETLLFPGGQVVYKVYIDTFYGVWQNGLRKCFQDKKLYGIDKFDESMYYRNDLQWIRHAYMIHLMMAWDQKLFNKNQYQLASFLKNGKKLYGGDDVVGIWPTWPALGLDQRNQWDMYRDMPEGLTGLKKLATLCHQYQTRLFIAYNPWDESTRKENHLEGMAALIKAIDADGVILDTRGSSSKELQNAVDKVKPGVIMYSEGMAVPKDMESIISGRVHNALYYPPILNLNKLIKPDFSIFRVAELYKEPIRREIHSALFNGYGIEFNLFHPGDPDWAKAQYLYLGRALKILRDNSDAFNDKNWTPLYPGQVDSIYINEWSGNFNKKVFTIYNSLFRGYNGPLFQVNDLSSNSHWVDLWEHKELSVRTGHIIINLDPFSLNDVATNNEGSVSVIARFEKLIHYNLFDIDSLTLSSTQGTHFMIYNGKPDYQLNPVRLKTDLSRIKLHSLFPDHDGDFVIQLFDSSELIDEIILPFKTSTTFKISEPQYIISKKLDPGMVEIPSGTFTWKTEHGDEFIPYPVNGIGESVSMNSFYIDAHPVTNTEYYTFLKKSHYVPKDKVNYLKHWIGGKIKVGDENKPVINVSTKDALAYCKWAHKRLPTEVEWQYAGQSNELKLWPWGDDAGIKNIKSERITETLTHIAFDSFDSTKANPGNGRLDPVNHYPKGKNKFGLTDLVGSVWQMTNDVYRTGSYQYRIIKGGSYYLPASSWWYVQGGPKPMGWRQMWLQVNDGFERSETVGFRCVRDKN